MLIEFFLFFNYMQMCCSDGQGRNRKKQRRFPRRQPLDCFPLTFFPSPAGPVTLCVCVTCISPSADGVQLG